MPEIAVIVPVFRAESYLHQCVGSILSQSFSDFELILVDDGSPDRSGEICEEFAKIDSRITVIHQDNQGQSAARNHAVALAKAPWICFVDSDDRIHPQTLELLYRAVKETGWPMSMAQMLEAPELPEDFLRPREGAYQVIPMDDETLAGMIDAGTYPAWVSCGKLIRRELIEHYPFRPGRVYEDNEAVCRWVVEAGKLVSLPEALYFYRTNPDSTTQRKFSLKKLDFLWALESIVNCYADAGFSQTCQRFLDRFIMETAGYYRMVKYEENCPDAEKMLKKNLHRCLKQHHHRLTKGQFEELLDAMHPKLIRIYWPLEGIVRTLHQEGLAGIARKLNKHLGGE